MTGEELLAEYAGGRRDFRGTVLAGVDLSGLYARGANLTGADLTDANLTDADLSGANLTRAYLSDADLIHANLTGADLTGADLFGANLTGANLAGVKGLPAAPVVEDLHRQIAEAVGADGEHLDMLTYMWMWHGTVHCRAGWAIALAGAAGWELGMRYGLTVAGALIYHASTGAVPDFYAQHADALKDIRLDIRLGVDTDVNRTYDNNRKQK